MRNPNPFNTIKFTENRILAVSNFERSDAYKEGVVNVKSELSLNERAEKQHIKFAEQALDNYLKKNPEKEKELFAKKEQRSEEFLRERAINGISERISKFMSRSQYQMEQVLENPETHENAKQLLENIVFEIAEAVCYGMELESKINIDPLTGLPNRGAFQKRLKEEIARSGRSDEPLCMLIFDLDNFKEINDTHGHSAGDKVLIEAAKKFQKTLRDSDFLARIGGDEFAMLLSGTNYKEACMAAYRILEEIKDPVQNIEVTVSIGVGEFSGQEKDPDGSDMFEAADKALYIIKGENPDENGVKKDRRGNIACSGKVIDKEEMRKELNKSEAEQYGQQEKDHRLQRRKRIQRMVINIKPGEVQEVNAL